MRYASARYTNAAHTMVSVLIDGVQTDFPAALTNSNYADMVRDSVPIADYVPKVQSYIDLRIKEYGSPRDQIEYAVENGFQALIDRNLAIKAKYPKPI